MADTPTLVHIFQPKDSSLCLAACVAMVSGETLATVVKECRLEHDPPDFDPWLSDGEAARFLATRRLSFGAPGKVNFPITASSLVFTSYTRLDEHPAILEVDGQLDPADSHAVVWCPVRRMVLDPQETELLDLADFTVTKWYVVQDFNFE